MFCNLAHCKKCSGFYSDGADEGITETADEGPSHVSYILLYVILISSRVYFFRCGCPEGCVWWRRGIRRSSRRRMWKDPKGEKKSPNMNFVIVWLLYGCFMIWYDCVTDATTVMQPAVRAIFTARTGTSRHAIGTIFDPTRTWDC